MAARSAGNVPQSMTTTERLPDPTDETAAILEQGRAMQEQSRELMSEIDELLSRGDDDR